MQRRFPEAEEAMRATLKLDPVHPYALPNLAHLLLGRGAAAEAETVYRDVLAKARAGELRTGVEHATLCLGLALKAQGREDEAQRVLREAVAALRAREARPTPIARAHLAALLAAAGRPAEARALAARVASAPGLGPGDRHVLAKAYAQLGDRDRALRLWEEAITGGYDDPYAVVIDPALASIRDDPAVERLVPPVPPA
jgi:hypothetical protein